MGMNLFEEDGSGDDSKIEIDKEYAKRYEYNKKREELQKYEEMKKKGLIGESSESDDDYDEDSDLVSGKKNLEFFDALIKVKKKDPILKEKDVKLFDSESDGGDEGDGDGEVSGKKKKEKKLYLKDVIAKQLLEDAPESDDDDVKRKDEGVKKVKSLAEEQEEARKAFLKAAEAAVGDDDDGDFLKFKESGEDRVDVDGEDEIVQSKLDEYFGSDDELDANSLFLKEFFRNKLYVDKSIDEKPIEEELKNLSESEDEEVEREINYRFEENAGDRVLGHSRVVEGSVRKKVSARKVQRLSREQRRAIAEVERMEEVKHMKTLKKQEFMERLKKVREVGGLEEKAASTLDEDDLEDEFDPEKYDKKMKQLYGDEYYGADDVDPDFGSDEDVGDEKPNFDKEDELLGLPKGWDKQYKEEVNEKEYEEELKEALYKLDYEDTIGDLKTRFKYAKVKPQRFGLTQEDILELDDKKLNQYVSLKKIAPYREKEWKVPSIKKYQFKQERKEQLNGGTSSGDFTKKGKRLRENGESSGKNDDAPKDEVTQMELDSTNGAEGKKNRRKRQKAELKLSQSRLLAYGKIPSKSKTKGN